MTNDFIDTTRSGLDTQSGDDRHPTLYVPDGIVILGPNVCEERTIVLPVVPPCQHEKETASKAFLRGALI